MHTPLSAHRCPAPAGTRVLALTGHADLDTAPALAHALSNALSDPPVPGTLVVDCSALGFCSSSGLNELLHARQFAIAAGIGFHLAAPPARSPGFWTSPTPPPSSTSCPPGPCRPTPKPTSRTDAPDRRRRPRTRSGRVQADPAHRTGRTGGSPLDRAAGLRTTAGGSTVRGPCPGGPWSGCAGAGRRCC
ncbi:STAS domain-containing protein [Kitasatospora sp. NPDC048545]|uniref:STAS domain-containing protein n=1 Tax=Kitasatospora sp. NPDC048545 TaxID=3157208 RepID=UPI0033FB21FE